MADTFGKEVTGREYPAGIDIDGVAYVASASVGEPYSAGSDTLHDVTIVIGGLAPWAADAIMRQLSETYSATVATEVG